MLEKTGIPTIDMIKGVFPPLERINKGPVAVIECYQKIPCNPCVTACKINAIDMGDDINNLPKLDISKCIGCGACVSKCPGLSIMIVDGSKDNDTVLFKIPYEFIPLPNSGDIVKGLNRKGDYITDVEVIGIQNTKSNDRTPVITVKVNRKYLYEFRNISY